LSDIASLIDRIAQREVNPPLIGFIDNDSISRSLSRYLFVAESVHGVVIDVGCGSCYGISIVKRIAGGQVIGVDIDANFLHYGKSVYGIGDLIVADARFLPFRKGTFDSVICLELIEHLSKRDQHRLCQGLCTILKKKGLLLISTPNKFWFSPLYKSLNPLHVRELYLIDLIDVLKNSGFQFYKIYVMGNEASFFNYLLNIFEYIFRSVMPKRVITFIGRSLSHRDIENVDPSPNYPIREASKSIWRFKWFIVKALKSR